MTDTLQAIDEAIQRHIGELEPGAVAESWIVVAHSQTIAADEGSGYRILTSDTQPHHVDAGLIEVGKIMTAAAFDATLYGDDD